MTLVEWALGAQAQTDDRCSRIVGRILLDLNGRSGIHLDDFDTEVNEEIITTLREIVKSEVLHMGRVINISAESTVGLGG